jgi:hypothetical protein
MARIVITFELTDEDLVAYKLIRKMLKKDPDRIKGILAGWVPANLDQIVQFLEEEE